MKKILSIIAISLVLIIVSKGVNKTETSNQVENISHKLIRFHVIANSDKRSDQNLKLKVRDEVIRYIQPKLKDCKNISESREVLKKNTEYINGIAKKVIKNNGYSYDVKTAISFENFPIKTYGNITLPQGKYEAFRVIIGEGKGQNWWCVMFPPLCFVDITKGKVAYKETEKTMKKVLTNDEYESVNNENKEDEIKYEFKVLELIRNIVKNQTSV